MRAPQERTVRDLYDRTRHKDLALPEESDMGRQRGGGGRTEGAEQPEVAPKIENDLTVRKISVPSDSVRVNAESGTCNVCFAPCSSCLHRSLAIVDSSMDCGSYQTCCARSESKNSLLVRSKKGLRTKGGENDDEFSATSSHASYSENGGNKAMARLSIAADSEVDMPDKRRRLLNHDSRPPRVECYDDNNSCVTGVSAANEFLLGKKKDKLSMSASSRDLSAKEYKDNNIVGHNRLRNSSVEESTEKKRSDLHVKQPSSYDRSVPADSPSLVTKRLLQTQSSARASQGLSPQRPSQGSGNLQDNIGQQHSDKVHISNNNVEHSQGGRTNNRNKVKAGSSSKDLENITSCSRNGSQEHAEIQSAAAAAKMIDNVKQGQNQDLSTDTSNGRKLNTQNVMMTDCGNSEGLIDVNVCDICGDVGREYLLATCTRCLEGAEHTYCMRVKLDKVPDDEWLCEECQINEEQNKTRSNHGVSTTNILDGKNPNPANMSNPKTLQVAVTDFDGRQTTCGTPITDHLSDNDKKTHSLPTDPELTQVKCATPIAERLDAKNKIFGSMANRKRLQVVTSDIEACPPTCGTPTAERLDKKSQRSEVLLNHKKLRVATDLESPLSSEGQLSPPKSGKRHVENTPSSNSRMFKTESPRKQVGYYREDSFNKSNKGSCKPPDNAPVRTIQAVKSAMTLSRSYSLGSMANTNAPVRSPQGPLSKQLSFKNSNSEPKVKQLTEGVASRLKPAKHSPRDLGEKGPIRTFMKSKSFKHEGSACKDLVSVKQKHSSHLSQDEKPRMLKPMKEKNLLEMRASFNLQKPNIPPSPRPESSIKSGDRKVNQDNPRPGQSILKSSKKPGTIEKKQCTSLPKSEKPCANVYPASIGVVSAKDGYAPKFSDPPRPAETINKDSTSDCPSFILLKNDNEIPVSDLQDMAPPCALEDLTPNMGQSQQKILEGGEGNESSKNAELVQDSEDILPSSPPGLLVAHNLDVPVNKLNGPILNHQDYFDQLSTFGNLSRTLVIPEQTYIWQGTFEVSRPGNSSEIHDGIQAHLSTYVSPKALEVVKQLLPTIQLVEVPRCTSWPQQFNEGNPSEDNIALFFFAKDVESYERAYGKLLEKMVVGDLSLVANINGIELLIFSSDMLPENIQRWNGLLYFWGVFYARKANSAPKLATVIDRCPLEPTTGTFDKLVCSPKAPQSLCIDLNECPDDELYDPVILPESDIDKSGASGDHETLFRSKHVDEKLDAPGIHHKENALAGQIVAGNDPTVPCDTCISTSSERGRKIKPDYPYNTTGTMKVAVRDSIEEEENFSPNEMLAKKQSLTSLTEVSLQHPSESTLKAGFILFDSDCSYKSQKTFKGRQSTSSSGDEQRSSKSLSKIHALTAGWHTAVDGAGCTYKVRADLGSAEEPILDPIVHVISSDDEDSPKPRSSLNKAPLKAEKRSSPLLSLSLSTAAKAHNLTGSDIGDDRSLVLSLGLSLPGVIKGNRGLEMKQFLPEKPG